MGTTALPGFGQAQSFSSQNVGQAAVQGVTPVTSAPSGVSVVLDDRPSIGPAPYAMNIDGEFNPAATIQDFALDRTEAAETFIGQLGQLAAGLVPPSVTPNYPALPSTPAISTTTAPALTPIAFNAPQAPAAFVEPLTIAAAFPTFDIAPPALAFPNAPQPSAVALPNAPAVDLNFVYPTVNVDLPPAPPLLSLDVQPFGGVDFPTLSATAPVLTAIEPSVVTYIPAAPYTDGVLTSLKNVLQQRLDVGLTGANTGLPPLVEEGIWNRSREREYRQQAAALADLDRMEAMGYALPPGAWVDSRIKIQTETAYTISTASRDVAVEQAKLEQQNIKDSLQLAGDIEGKLIEYENQREQRQFEALKYATEAGIELYNAQVKVYEVLTEAYRASIAVFQAQIEGAKAQVDIYTAEVQAEKLKVDANAVTIQSYKVKVDAALASIQVFEGEIQLVKTQAEVEQIKVSIFGEQVRAYATEAQFFATQVEAYKAGVEAVTAQQAAYATSASAYGTLVSATAKEIDAQVETFKAQLEAATLQVEVYKAEVQSEAERVRAIASQDTATAAIYSSTVQGTSSFNNALVERYRAAGTLAEQLTQIGVSAAEANGKLYLSAAQIASDAAKVGAQVEAQIAASALGAVTFATHKSRTDGLSYSQSVNYSESKSVSQSSSTNEGLSTSVSYSNSASVSATTSATQGFSNNTNIAEAQ